MSKRIVGIDLGTTNSLIGILRAGEPVLLPTPVGDFLTPSVVSLDDTGELLVGEAARARVLTHPQLSAANFKRDMGTAARYQLGSLSLSAPELSAAVLASLQRDAEAALGEVAAEHRGDAGGGRILDRTEVGVVDGEGRAGGEAAEGEGEAVLRDHRARDRARPHDVHRLVDHRAVAHDDRDGRGAAAHLRR
ncbi:MAG: Hsp70 family protein, partial [Myxococcales bacterium]|nr:Hsp70 family protein [Myxococcales bacterium]